MHLHSIRPLSQLLTIAGCSQPDGVEMAGENSLCLGGDLVRSTSPRRRDALLVLVADSNYGSERYPDRVGHLFDGMSLK